MTAASKPCFAHRHMAPKEFGLWNYLRSVSHKSGLIYFDGRQIAAQFYGVSKSTIYRIRDSLIAGGWLVPTKGSKKTANRTYTAGEYRALSHEEWAAAHQGMCNWSQSKHKPRAINNDSLQMQCKCTTGSLSHGRDSVQSHGRDNPVPRAGHNLNLNLNPSYISSARLGRSKDLPNNFEANASNRQRALSLNLDIDAIVEDFVLNFGIIGNKRRNWQAVLRTFIDQIACDCEMNAKYPLRSKPPNVGLALPQENPPSGNTASHTTC